ncbi:hypothetical protein BS47DRAFT_1297739 [Hydnum rufescens UP504]|uniref:Uncharacterized protein n=1 Tax=Hydnum rufescens UP504 TaxID=1448309 RepID=A0A9P6AUX6_9AGAM|nr:hypothetical protein BS47DRAFT_1297739 [Hydnum rufescens UP504]
MAPVVLITGSSAGGIGGSLVESFAAAGCIVYASARRMESMDGLKDVGDIRKVQMDVDSDDSVSTAVKTILDTEGPHRYPDQQCVTPVLDVSLETAEKTFQTNVFGVLRTQRAVVPHMAERKSGLVINVGSISAIIPIPFGGIYAATKAAVRSITEALYNECRPLGVNVMLIEPGGVRSNVYRYSIAVQRYELPSNSLYKDYIDSIMARIYSSQGPSSMKTDEFAGFVVKNSLRPKPARYLSIGAKSTFLWILGLLPRSFSLWVIWKFAARRNAPAN